VFSDKTLRAMAESRPSTPHELLAVSGVGPLKLERYGEAFMEAVSQAPTNSVAAAERAPANPAAAVEGEPTNPMAAGADG